SFGLAEYLERRKQCLEMLETIIIQKNQKPRLLKLAESLGRKERKEFDLYLEILLVLLQDLAYLQVSFNVEIINFDITNQLLNLVNQATSNFFINLASNLIALERDLPRNINRQMALEKILLNLK
ncbi:MAG: hypothetical protein FD167_2298, partial [bacterium]